MHENKCGELLPVCAGCIDVMCVSIYCYTHIHMYMYMNTEPSASRAFYTGRDVSNKDSLGHKVPQAVQVEGMRDGPGQLRAWRVFLSVILAHQFCLAQM